MSQLVDLFGYLSIILHGLTIVAQSMTLGGVLFLALLARPLWRPLGTPGDAIMRGCVRITAWSALGLVLCEATTVALQAAVLVGTVDLSVLDILGANFAVAGMVKMAMAALIGLVLVARGTRAPVVLLLVFGAVELAAATLTTHAAARLNDRAILLVVAGLHQFGAAIWVGGLPCFLLALARVNDGAAWRLVGARFSRMSMTGVACILASGIVMSLYYVGSWDAFYGTAYGVMVGAKIAMFLMLLGLGGMNFLLVERLRGNPAAPVNRLKRFAEVEVGIGFTIFFAAASLTSVPPAVDLTRDRVSFHEIVERNTPVWPRFASPDHDVLALPALQAQLDAQATQSHTHEMEAFTPGAGELAPRNAADIAWSEYNHHWAGIFVLAIGLLALLNQAGLRWARHWPLLFLGLAGFLFVRSDPENWPLGHIGLHRKPARRGGVAASGVRAAADRLRAVRVAGARQPPAPPAGVAGVSADLRRRRRAAAHPQPRHRQHQGRAADRAHAHAAGTVCRPRRVVALAGAAARPARQPDRRVGLAGVLAAGRAATLELPGGLKWRTEVRPTRSPA